MALVKLLNAGIDMSSLLINLIKIFTFKNVDQLSHFQVFESCYLVKLSVENTQILLAMVTFLFDSYNCWLCGLFILVMVPLVVHLNI